MKKALLIAVGLCFVAAPVLAFHDGGVARCNSCHTMHNSQNGVLVDPDAPDGNPWLLVDSTPSDVCLSCHATGLGAVYGDDFLAPPPMKGAGNFTFLDEDNLMDGYGASIPGSAAGHNLASDEWGPGADLTLTTAPGGTFLSANLGCTSCHDPHGNTNFRMLNGQGMVQGLFFLAGAPEAEGISIHGGGSESWNNHTAYKSGMSAWCGNCHGDFHANTEQNAHAAGMAMGQNAASVYNSYNGTSVTGGTGGTPYIPEVAFEDPNNATDSAAGPSSTSQVSCITCHRAHGSSAPDAGRWDFNVTFLADDGGGSGSYAIPNPYEGTAGVNQRSLCNKCHNQDFGDGPNN